MKKIVCLLMALLLCLVPMIACQGESITQKEGEKLELDLKEFTGVALSGWQNGGKEVTLEVCEEYRSVLGDTVKVVTTKRLDTALSKGMEVKVTIDYVLDTTPRTVYTSRLSAYDVEVEPDPDQAMPEKPVIYLYPEEDTECSVKVTFEDGDFTCTYPDYGKDGWQNFTARPDGTLVFPDGKEYYCLYWEGKMSIDLDFSRGFCVSGSDTAAFLEKTLADIGLNAREANEFIIYWLPILQKNPYNLISFQTDNYENAAKLEVTPTPDSLLRVYMVAKPLDAPVEIEAQTFEGFARNGFTVVEWGGSIVK